MILFLIKRAVFFIISLLIASALIFYLLNYNQESAVLSYLRANSIEINQENINKASVLLGFNKSLIEQYFIWLGDVVKLDFGKSLITNKSINQILFYHFKNTFILGLLSLIWVIIFSIVLTLFYFINIFKKTISILAFLLICTPNFLFAIFLIIIFSLKLHILDPLYDGNFSTLLMPSFAISSTIIGINLKFIISNIKRIENEQFILFAKALKINKIKLFFKYILLNAILPLFSYFSMQIAEIFSGAIIVENMFSFPGVGRFVLNAILNHDYKEVGAFMICMVALFLTISLINEILNTYLIKTKVKL